MIFKSEYKTIKKSGLFDEQYYLKSYKDVRKADIDPIKHYIKNGWREGRNPSERFDTNFYLDSYPDVRDAGINPLVHFIQYGSKEGRSTHSQNSIVAVHNVSKIKKLITIAKYAKNNPQLIKKAIQEVKLYGIRRTIKKVFYKASEIKMNESQHDINNFYSFNKFRIEPNKKNIDIIIPIYNGFDFLIDCFNSILINTDLTKHRLILVDDGSNENDLLSFYETLKNDEYKNTNIILIKNKNNIGFIGSVNNGMQQNSANDVILLNSDTVVTRNWVEKMTQAAYSKSNIGTVTALSNNATLCSVPKQWEDNEIPVGFDLDTFASFVEFVSPCDYPEIPSPVGFCMYIKRECLNKFGYFDTIYGKGYAEENDFGMRLYVGGYIHICDDTTFIHHKGSMTFGNNPEKLEKIKKNADILYQRYPQLKDLLKGFEQNNTMQRLYANLDISLNLKNNSCKIVLLVNVAPLRKFPSGALKHQIELVEYFRNLGYVFINFYSENSKDIFIEIFTADQYHQISLGCYEWDCIDVNITEVNELFSTLINVFDIKIVHFQTPQHFSLSLIETAKKENTRVFFTLHDFLLYCHNYTLINNESKFCNFETDIEKCKQCLSKTSCVANIEEYKIIQRKEYIKYKIFDSVDLFISPSQSHKDLISKYLTIESDKIEVFPHPFNSNISTSSKEINEILNVAFIGNFTDIKGSEYFEEIVRTFANQDNIYWYIIGKIHDVESYSKLSILNNVTFYGEYQYEDIFSILDANNIHLAINLSKCFESYSYTLTEAFTNNVLTITGNHGAVAERIYSNPSFGWVVDSSKLVENVCKLLRELIEDKSLISSKLIMVQDLLKEVTFEQYEKIYYEEIINVK